VFVSVSFILPKIKVRVKGRGMIKVRDIGRIRVRVEI